MVKKSSMLNIEWADTQPAEGTYAVRGLFFLGQALLVLLIAGCGIGDQSVSVLGEVSYGGKAVDQGQIVFRPVDGTTGPITGGEIKSGRYELTGDTRLQPGGTYRVEITGLAASGKTIPNIMNPNGDPVEVMENYISPVYNAQSTLKWTLPSDAFNTRRDFRLEAKSFPRR